MLRLLCVAWRPALTQGGLLGSSVSQAQPLCSTGSSALARSSWVRERWCRPRAKCVVSLLFFSLTSHRPAILIVGGAVTIGVGLSYLLEAQSWVPQQCVESLGNDSEAQIAFGVNTTVGGCPPAPLATVLVSVDSVGESGTALGNSSAYLIDPTADLVRVSSALLSWLASAPHRVPFQCWVRKTKTPMTFPDACPACDLQCTQTSPPAPVLLFSSVIEHSNSVGIILIAIGSGVCGGGLVLFVVFLTLAQLNVGQRQTAVRIAE